MMIADREVAADAPLFVIAEIGLNHGGDIDEALALVDAAAGAGASAVKLQSLRGETLVTAGCPGAGARRQRIARSTSSVSSSSTKPRMPLSPHGHARAAWPSCPRPFDEAAVDMLERRRLRRLQDRQRRRDSSPPDRASRADRQAARDFHRHERPRREVSDAVAVARRAGATSIAVLHCVSAYPVPAGSENLRAIATLARELGPASRPLRSRHE